MSSEILRKYIDIVNEQETLNEEMLEEGMLQKLAGLALGTVLALGPKIGQADTIYSYLPADSHQMQTATDYNQIPKDAKAIFEIDTDTSAVHAIKVNYFSKRPAKGQEIQPDPAAVKQGQQGQAQVAQPQAQQPQAQQPQDKPAKVGTVYENNDWTAKYDKNAMTDEPSCTIFSKKNRHVQVNVEADGSGTFYDSFKGRGGLKKISYGRYGSYMPIKYRLDNDPAKEFTPTGAAAEIQVIALPLSEIQGKSKITIQVFTVLDEVVTDSIDLNSLNPAVSKCVQAMNQK